MEQWVEWLKYSFLGLLQGITEPIPISSSGHVVIAQHLFGLEIEGLSFEVLVNFASLLAVLVIYRSDLIRLVYHGWRYIVHRDPGSRSEFQFIVLLVVATVPAGVLGVLFNDLIGSNLKGMVVIGATLLVTGVALWAIRKLKGQRGESNLTLKDAVIIGLAQAVALIPGISRSGATIVAAMSRGIHQETALRFSFMLYIPISAGGMVLEGSELIRDPELANLAVPYTLAFICALVASYFSLKWFMGIMARGKLGWFSIYCFIAGAAVLFFLT